jgi:small-conductance mechanosensitive channel
VVSEVVKTIYDTLNAHGVGIPFPQRDVHIIQS